jgi:hypothetical protein
MTRYAFAPLWQISKRWRSCKNKQIYMHAGLSELHKWDCVGERCIAYSAAKVGAQLQEKIAYIVHGGLGK